MIKLNVLDLFNGNVEGCKFINEDYLNEVLVGKFEMNGVSIEKFDFSDCEIMLVESDGYRGVGCYEGLVVKNNISYYIDIVNDGVVFKI